MAMGTAQVMLVTKMRPYLAVEGDVIFEEVLRAFCPAFVHPLTMASFKLDGNNPTVITINPTQAPEP